MGNKQLIEFQTKKGKPLPLGVTIIGNNVNFAITVPNDEECRLNIYEKDSGEKITSILLDKNNKIGDVYSIMLTNFDAVNYEYNYEIRAKEYVDPYAKVVHGRELWGKYLNKAERSLIRGGFEYEGFDWEEDKPLQIKYSDLIIYKAHVRGFTKHTSSKVKNKGCFSGMMEKIPYLKELGINCLELMPIYEFDEISIDKRQRAMEDFIKDIPFKINYWGYAGPSYYFSPKASYSSSADKYGQVAELKELIKELHKNGIEVVMEFYFEDKANKELILECLRYWVMEYHIDGFHINSDISPTSIIAVDPILAKTKLFSTHWETDKIYKSDFVPKYKNLAEYNDGFLIEARKFLKSDEGQVEKVSYRMRKNGSKVGIINYIANHDGFTLMDLYSYDVKHNDGNLEGNRDGTEYNYSWNCGVEGKTKRKKIIDLRRKQIKNALITLFLSQGTPMLLSGDEMGKTQNGNNNSYCQDNQTSWLNWNNLEANKDIFEFVKQLIYLRKSHGIFHLDYELRVMDYISCGSPDISYHGSKAWYPDYRNYSRILGIMLCGKYSIVNKKEDNYFYIAFNMHWENHPFDLPKLPNNMTWRILIDTNEFSANNESLLTDDKNILENQKRCEVKARSIVVFIGK